MISCGKRIDIIADMANLTVPGLDDAVKDRLRVRAAGHGRSMGEEAREILAAALTTDSDSEVRRNLAQLIRRRICPSGGIELTLRSREPIRRPVIFPK